MEDYIGYDSTTGDTARLDDGGNKSRLGLKIKSGNIIGNLEYKYDIGDGTSGAGNNCGTNNANGCQTFDLHIGNLGFMTPLGYLGQELSKLHIKQWECLIRIWIQQ